MGGTQVKPIVVRNTGREGHEEEKVLQRLFINGIRAEALSGAVTDPTSNALFPPVSYDGGADVYGLDAADLRYHFEMTEAEATQAMSFIQDVVNAMPPRGRDLRFVDIDYVPVCRSATNASTPAFLEATAECRPSFPNQTAFAATVSKDYSQILPQGNWHPENYQRLRQWLSRLSMTRPESQVLISDFDNTLVAGTIGPVVSKEAEIRGWAKWRPGEQPPYLEYYQETHPGFVFDPKKVTPHEWWNLLSKFDPQLDANALSMGFAGMTVRQIADCVDGAEQRSPNEFPKPYPELVQLLNYLTQTGRQVGVVSASPYLAVAIALKKAGYHVPLYAIEGTDFYVKHPKTGELVALSNLVNAELLKEKPNATIDDVIARYGDLVALRNVDPVQRGQEGKGPAGVSIAWRGMDYWNTYKKGAGESPLTLDNMRLVGYCGDNTGPFSDLFGASPVQSGNDQGMVRVLVPENLMVLNIIRGGDAGAGKLDFVKKAKNVQEFRRFVEQLKRFYSSPVVIEQRAVADGAIRGSFVDQRYDVIRYLEDHGARCSVPEGASYAAIGPEGAAVYQPGLLECSTQDPGYSAFTVELADARSGASSSADINCSPQDLSCRGPRGEFTFRIEETPEGPVMDRISLLGMDGMSTAAKSAFTFLTAPDAKGRKSVRGFVTPGSF